jgi:hypothetical protein
LKPGRDLDLLVTKPTSRFHVGRPFLVPRMFGRLPESLPEQRDPLDLDRPDAPATPLPPDRPAGSTPERIEEAAQEFLTDWLVRRQYDQALAFVSPNAYACLNVEDSGGSQALDAAARGASSGG